MSGLAPTLPLRSGAEIPVLGLGTSPLQGAESATQVRTALEVGYRLIDTAENYRNEDAVGEALRESGIDRSEVFITTKFNRRWHSVAGVREAYGASLKRLGVDYVDLLLVHWPNPDQIAMSTHYAAWMPCPGKTDSVRSARPTSNPLIFIGSSKRPLRPAANQIQLNPRSTRPEQRAYHADTGLSPRLEPAGRLRRSAEE